MIDIVTWNVQAGKGVDGRIDLTRIARVARTWGEPDVLCLQEIACHVPGLGECDQVQELCALFPGYQPAFGAAVDRAGPTPDAPRCRFGNLILSRLSVHEIFHHPLPQPADPAVRHMPRQVSEAVVAAPSGPLRVMTTHFEFHTEIQRLAQAWRVRDLQLEVLANVRQPAKSDRSGLYGAPIRPQSCVICGDFNAVPDDPVYALLADEDEDDELLFVDAWRAGRGDAPHDPTCGIFDTDQWPQGAHCRDFFFVSPDLAPGVQAIDVNIETDASDHQPLRLRLAL